VPRIGPIKRRLLVAVLRANGLEETNRGKGGHTVFEHPTDPTRWTVLQPRNEVPAPLVRRIIHQAGKTTEEYLRHLEET